MSLIYIVGQFSASIEYNNQFEKKDVIESLFTLK